MRGLGRKKHDNAGCLKFTNNRYVTYIYTHICTSRYIPIHVYTYTYI